MPKQAKQEFLLGTTVKITTFLNIDTAATATITIKDPIEVEQVEDANMTKDANGVYSYLYQSSTDNDDGSYLATITVTYGGYTSVVQTTFTLVDQD